MNTTTSATIPAVLSQPPTGLLDRLRLYVRYSRPFTLLPPMLGVVSGAITAFGSAANPDPARALSWSVLLTVTLGSLCAGILNAASNIVNQVYDLEIDRVNKPERPLPSGLVTVNESLWLTVVLTVLAVVPTWLVVIYPYNTFWEKWTAPLVKHECMVLYILGLLFALIYSMPQLGRTKARGIWANLTIAMPRGCLLKVAGWSMVGSVLHLEPWFIGTVFFLFIVGASSTKDFSDIDGDLAGGCQTLPILYGVKRAAQVITPFFFLPWLLIPIGTRVEDPWNAGRPILTGNAFLLNLLAGILCIWGLYVAYLMLRRPEELAETENHPSWTHMYLIMMTAQVGFAVAYLF